MHPPAQCIHGSIKKKTLGACMHACTNPSMHACKNPFMHAKPSCMQNPPTGVRTSPTLGARVCAKFWCVQNALLGKLGCPHPLVHLCVQYPLVHTRGKQKSPGACVHTKFPAKCMHEKSSACRITPKPCAHKISFMHKVHEGMPKPLVHAKSCKKWCICAGRNL